MPGYKVIRADHPSNRRRGGSAIFIKNSIKHDVLPGVIEEEVQVARIAIYLDCGVCQIGALYSAPCYRVTEGILLSIFHEMQHRFILGGDYNCKHPRWGSSVASPRGRLLHDVAYRLRLEFFYPVEPTHYPDSGHIPDVLDFFVTKNVDQYCLPPRVIHDLSSDHIPVILNVSTSPSMKQRPESLIRYPFNWKCYRNTVEELTNLKIPLKTPTDIDQAVSFLTRTIQTAATIAGPQHDFRPNTSLHTRYYSSPHIIQLWEEKKACRRQWEQSGYPPHKRLFNRATRTLRDALRKERTTAMEDELAALEVREGSLWKKTRALTKRRDGIPPLKMNGHWTTTPQDKTDLFAQILEQQFTPHPILNPNFNQHIIDTIQQPLQLTPFNTHFTPHQVQQVINRCSPKKCPGYDLIVQPLLKNLPRKGLVMLTQIYNSILRTTYFPNKWKHAYITMIHKTGKQKDDPKHYRPISLLTLFSKIFERLLLPKLLEFLEHLIPDTQFGFRQLHSCPQQLHRVTDIILDTFEEKKVCLGLFIDTEKAFDKVWHDGLLFKIKPHLPDTYFRLLQSYLLNRTYSVKIENSLSTSHPIKSGVPQGSVLGPFLYTLFTHDFPTSQHITLAQFADDTAALCKASTSQLAAQHIQTLANIIDEWCANWRVSVNPTKSTLVQFTYLRNTNPVHIYMNNVRVPTASSVKYLGLTLDSKLTWDLHIRNIVQKARQQFYKLRHILHRQSKTPIHLKRLIYTLYIKPIWQYACSIWNSASHTHIHKIQVLQNRILRMALNAPWYIRNTTIHKDIQLPFVIETLHKSYSRHHSSLTDHPNPIIRHIPQNMPPPRHLRRLKRKRTTDILTHRQL
jgi:hypothetical protein